MIDHERARELASMAPDAGIDPSDREWLDRHLDACDACRDFVAGSTAAGLDGLSTDASDANLEHLAVAGGPVADDIPTPANGRARPGRLRNPDWIRRRGPIVTVGALIVALVAGMFVWNSGKQPDQIVADAGSPSPAPSATAPAPDPWASLDPSSGIPEGGIATTATLTADGSTGPVVGVDTAFRLASTTAMPASRLAARLTVDPSFAFSVKPDPADRVAVITPAEKLLPGTVYRFDLHGSTGELLDTWAFQAKQPLRVVGTLPENESSDVPIDTGIEVTFDQDGVSGADTHVSITPATKGRFEQHGRVLVFVPNRLLPATIYTVTVSRGVTVADTGEATISDVKFQFETAAKTEPTTSATTFVFQDQLVETATADRAILGIWSYTDDDKPVAKKVRLEVYRLAGIDAAITAFRTLRTQPTWSRWSTDGLVPTTHLQRVLTTNANMNSTRGTDWAQLPTRLPAGWYLVQQSSGTRPIQLVLQVTDIAGYLTIADAKTLVWANDLKSGGPIVGAAVAANGVKFGRTDAKGLVLAATPDAIKPSPAPNCTDACDPIVTIRTSDGRAVFMPAQSEPSKFESYDSYGGYGEGDSRYWTLLHTDRNRYRQTDTVNTWGVLRARGTGKVPSTVTVQLTAENFDGVAKPPVTSRSVHPGPTGAFLAPLALAGLPEGSYSVELLVGTTMIRSVGVQVGPIAKPAYRFSIETGRHVYIAGDNIRVTARANFFEGTPVPGIPLRINGYVERTVTTDATGVAIYRTTARVDRESEGPQPQAIEVVAARAEEADTGASSNEFVVFPSSRTVDAVPVISHGRVRVTGTVNLVDVARLEREASNGASLWDLDPRGAVLRGVKVTVRFVELVPVRTATGTEYDFIEKKVVQTYETNIVERPAGTVTVTSGANGGYSASIPVAPGGHDYQVIVSVADADGHVARITGQASTQPFATDDPYSPSLAPTVGPADGTTYRIGDQVDVTMRDSSVKQRAGDGTRYLFSVAQLGIRSATVQSSPRFKTTFPSWGAPNIEIEAVRFTGRGYTGRVTFGAQFRVGDRKLQVDLTPAAARYRPGDLATVRIRVRDAAGRPAAATVVLRAIDEKLYSIGAASQDDPLAELYSPLSSGIVSIYQTHRNPRSGGEGGDTTGGGGDDRDDFQDSLLFQTVTTDTSGRGTVSFRLSDDLTSWRVTASAITTHLEMGAASVLVPVGLPFFVDATIAPEYLVADRPIIVLRAFGAELKTGAAVSFRVTAPGLDFTSPAISGKAFETTTVALPKLRLGSQTIKITATTGSGASLRRDTLTRTFNVVTTRLTRARTAYAELPLGGPLAGGDGFTTILVSDASGGRYLPMLLDLAGGGGARLDRGLAADMAVALLRDRFGSTVGDPVEAFRADRYQGPNGGLALLPYASPDLELSAMVAIVAPDRVNRVQLMSYLRGIVGDPAETRERKMFALAGLAGLGDSVLPAVRAAAADTTLTIREQLMIGIGAAALGDAATARSIAASLIAKHGEQLGEQARLRVGSSGADITSATALMAVLEASIGDDRAASFWAYVEANPETDALNVLPAAAYAAKSLDRLPVKAATFAYTVDGTRRVVTLDTAQSFQLTLTGAQLKTLTLERIAGAVGVTTTWREATGASVFQPDPDVKITRTVTPSGTVKSSDLVRVELRVTFGAQAASGCHQVTELVPSGLAPVGSVATWVDPDSEDAGPPDPGLVLPYDQSGSRVFFCAEFSPQQRILTLRYYARVVTPGTYAWEPAVAESRSQDGQASLTPASEIVVR
ncbi:MAG TPA: Ig-like domain-containing protein [Verrucomicrobiae bacterium]|nr:Ig-like domain-containing protein [Verrucomicrobiae bacterium]